MPKQSGLDIVLSLKQQGYADAEIIDYMKQQGFRPKEILEAINQAKIKQAAEIEKQAIPLPQPQPQQAEEQVGQIEEQPSAIETGEVKGMQPSILTQEGQVEQIKPEPQIQVPAPTPSAPAVPTPQTVPETTGEVMPPTAGPAQPYYPYQYPYQQYETYETATPVETIEQLSEEIINEKWQQFEKKFGNIAEIKKEIISRIDNINSRVEKLEQRFDKINLMLLEKMGSQERTISTVGKEIDMLENTFKKVLDPLMTNIHKLNEIVSELKKVKKSNGQKSIKGFK
jgi:hypothetical protein